MARGEIALEEKRKKKLAELKADKERYRAENAGHVKVIASLKAQTRPMNGEDPPKRT